MQVPSNISSTINVTARGLQVQQLSMDTAGSNIANANTPNYSRGDVTVLAGGAYGLNQEAYVSRAQAPLAEQAVHEANRAASFSQAHYDYLRVQVAPLLGDMSANNLVQSMDAFFSSWRNLAIEPNNIDLRQQLLGRGEALTDNLRNAARRLRDQQTALDQSVVTLVSDATESIQEVARLNGDILVKKAGKQSTLDDENRQADLIHQLVGDLGVEVRTDADGSQRLLLADGNAIVSGPVARPVSTRIDATTGFQHVIIDTALDQNLDGLITGGKLHAMLTTRDTDLAGFATTLDQLCADLATQVNTQHQAGFGLDGVSARNFFTPPPAPIAGFARGISLDPAMVNQPTRVAAASAAATLPSEAVNSGLIAGLGDALLASGNTQTFSDGLRSLSTQVGQVTQAAGAQAEQARARLQGAEAVRTQQQGISQQEQIIAARRCQMAYQVGLKVLDIQFRQIDSLLALTSR